MTTKTTNPTLAHVRALVATQATDDVTVTVDDTQVLLQGPQDTYLAFVDVGAGRLVATGHGLHQPVDMSGVVQATAMFVHTARLLSQ